MLKIYFWIITGWFILLFLFIIFRKRKVRKLLLYLVLISFSLILLEALSLIALKINTGYWLFTELHNPNAELFKPNPYMVSEPIPGACLHIRGITYTHNSLGFRNKEFKKGKNKFRIIAIGGSTTYGTGVSDHQTWPYYLDSLLEPKAEVLNFGVSGHSTVEHLAQSFLIVPDYHPDAVILLCGLNDLRNCFIKNVRSDYTDFHPYNLEAVLGFHQFNKLPRFALIRVSILLLQKIGYYPYFNFQKVHIEEEHSIANDQYMLGLYRRNLCSLVNQLKFIGAEIVLVPQVLHPEAVKGGGLKWWIPYVKDNELIPLLDKYNEVGKEVADSMKVIFASDVLNAGWKATDFTDPSHFTPEANLKFAGILENCIRKNILPN
ncbi:MAG: SGNH/GDSL hydrolase family protein [Sphingobacteriales bacterium]|nr:SGNH/GDSL hydrolase family protein [Sphingobacteriales bacterium]